ncbi:MAG: FAD-binding oxidoreductase [Devosia sp.]|nr:FAD-binding oxidoreductase [Devosia sp.]
MHADTIVLGAGIVGVSIAVHLARRGRAVALVDRRQPGEETSFGNAGLIQQEGIFPHAFPQNLGVIARYGLNTSLDMRYHLADLPRLAPYLARYWWFSRPRQFEAIARSYARLIAASVSEHAVLVNEAKADGLIVRNGWFELFRTAAAFDKAGAEAEWLSREFGVASARLDQAMVRQVEPGLKTGVLGALHWRDPWTVRSPHELTLAYLSLFRSLGGHFVKADARTLNQQASGGWTIATADGPLASRQAVLALGPWSTDITRRLGYRIPLEVQRGYAMHYQPVDGEPLRNWIADRERGYLLAPMLQGIRLTTGAEFARRDAPKTPVQLAETERVARQLFPLGVRLDPEPWMGGRPCTPDMLPVIGPAPRHNNLWFAFGHAHRGLTLGPVTGRLIAEMLTGETPFVNAEPFSAGRFAAL